MQTTFRQIKKISYSAAMAIFFVSCGNSQQNTDKSSQAKIDSMSQALMKQHLIDSMNSAATVTSVPAAETSAPVRRNHESYSNSNDHNRSYGGRATVNNAVTPAPVPVTYSAPVVNNTVISPSAEDLAAKKKADHKKELKSAAEGALIGAGAGAIGGAVVGKNDKFKKQDAAIGGGLGAVVGAGAGLLLEKRKLKKDTTQH